MPMELRAASRLQADHLGASRTAFRLRFDHFLAKVVKQKNQGGDGYRGQALLESPADERAWETDRLL